MIPRPSASRIPLPTQGYGESAGSSTDPFSLGSSHRKRAAAEAFDVNGLGRSFPRQSPFYATGLSDQLFCLDQLLFSDICLHGQPLMIDSSSSRRPLSGSMSTTSLQRRVMELEAKDREGQLEIEELRNENARLKTERRMLHEGEEQERNTGQEREKQFSDERVC